MRELSITAQAFLSGAALAAAALGNAVIPWCCAGASLLILIGCIARDHVHTPPPQRIED